MTKDKSTLISRISILLHIITLAAIAALFTFNYTGSEKTAYVDTGKLMQNYQGMVDAQKAFKQKAALWETNVDTLMGELQAKIKEYEKTRASMSEKERKLTEELLQSKQQQLRQYQEATQKKAEEEDRKLTQGVVNQVDAYLADYGKKHNYRIIFGTSGGNIVYADDVLDITDDVLEGLNRQYNGEM